jgi:hypothetical protein
MGAPPCIWTFLSSLNENRLFSIQPEKRLAIILPESSLSGKRWSGEEFLGILLGLENRIAGSCIVVPFLV